MAELNQIIDVQITRATSIPTQRGFGTPLLLGDSDRFTAGERVRSYSSIEEVEADFTAGDFEITMATQAFSQQVRPPIIKIGQVEAGDSGDYVAALNAIQLVDDDWYGLVVETVTEADILAIAAWVQARVKLFGALSRDAAVIAATAGNVLEDLVNGAFFRSPLLYSNDTNSHAFAAWFGRQLPQPPGSTNWAYKTLAGVTVDDLNTTQQNNVTNNRGSIYIQVAGINQTQFGRTNDGDWIDVIRGADFIQARMQENVLFRLANTEKIPFTNDGIAVIQNEMEAVLITARDVNGIITDYVIEAPDVSEVPVIDRGNRFLSNMKFTATLAGAINTTQIRGTLQL